MAKTTYFRGNIAGHPADGWVTETDDEEEIRLARVRREEKALRRAESTCGPVCKTAKAAAAVGVGVLILSALATKK